MGGWGHAALLVFLSAAAGAGIIAAYFHVYLCNRPGDAVVDC